MPNGSVIGDRANLALTSAIMDIGWIPPQPRSCFDLLPIVIETPAHEIHMFEMPKEAVREVPMEHPNYPAFGKLGLKWAAVPAICSEYDAP